MQTEPQLLKVSFGSYGTHGTLESNQPNAARLAFEHSKAMRASYFPIKTPPKRIDQGFTMVEVLVALFIVAVTLISGIKASGTLIQSAERQRSNLLAQVCIDNYLVAIRLSKQLPGTGEQVVSCEQALQTLTLKAQINTTPNPSFRRVDIQAFEQRVPILRVSTVLGVL